MTRKQLSCVVVGSGGQDGTLLSQSLSLQGRAVYRIARHEVTDPNGKSHGPLPLTDTEKVSAFLRHVGPAEIYYLAAYHHASEQKEPETPTLLRQGYAIHVDGLLCFLQGMLQESPESRLFFAASSRIFRPNETHQIDETSVRAPEEPYGMTKLLGVECCEYYRKHHSLFAVSGFLFNHESSLRLPAYLSKKVALGAAKASLGMHPSLVVGGIDGQTDWGHAPDFVDAMQRIVAHSSPEDFIIATGRGHSVRDFLHEAFHHVGLSWEEYVTTSPDTARSHGRRIGNADKLHQATGWKPTMTFSQMVAALVDETRLALQQ